MGEPLTIEALLEGGLGVFLHHAQDFRPGTLDMLAKQRARSAGVAGERRVEDRLMLGVNVAIEGILGKEEAPIAVA